jgi:hypothetical protein
MRVEYFNAQRKQLRSRPRCYLSSENGQSLTESRLALFQVNCSCSMLFLSWWLTGVRCTYKDRAVASGVMRREPPALKILTAHATSIFPHGSPYTMCSQVVESFNVHRCLYYKHAVHPCAAYGECGHTVQEKIVLVGYACELNSSENGPGAACPALKVEDIIHHNSDTDDSSENGDSVFFTAIAVIRATSFISAAK